jgi:hypothetical protein
MHPFVLHLSSETDMLSSVIAPRNVAGIGFIFGKQITIVVTTINITHNIHNSFSRNDNLESDIL